MSRPVLPINSPVTTTVYSALWPETEALVRRCYQLETEAMLARHRAAHTKHQDGLHASFFAAWEAFATPLVRWSPNQFPERYPCAGSSEAIRDILRMATFQGQDLVIFDGEYEGYEAIAAAQGTRVHRVRRGQWRPTLERWRTEGVPWRGTAQWWISQPSALDGNVWPDFAPWLDAVEALNAEHSSSAVSVWVDLCYLGATTRSWQVDLTGHPAVAGLVFSLSKVMGAYYRRIGGCLSRDPLPGLWGNRWFKNLDSLYLGERWLTEVGMDHEGRQRLLSQRQAEAIAALPLDAHWAPSDVALLVHAKTPCSYHVPKDPQQALWWAASVRGQDVDLPASRRLCLTPTLVPGDAPGVID